MQWHETRIHFLIVYAIENPQSFRNLVVSFYPGLLCFHDYLPLWFQLVACKFAVLLFSEIPHLWSQQCTGKCVCVRVCGCCFCFCVDLTRRYFMTEKLSRPSCLPRGWKRKFTQTSEMTMIIMTGSGPNQPKQKTAVCTRSCPVLPALSNAPEAVPNKPQEVVSQVL